MGQTNNDGRFRILISTNPPRQQRLLVGRQDSKTEVCTCSQFPAEAMLWIKKSHFKRRISLEEQEAQKQDRFLRGRQIAYLIYEYFRVTGANDSVGNYADLFTIGLRNDDIQEFDSKWDGILSSMTKIPSNDILDRLYKLRIRESQKTQDRTGIVQKGDLSEESWT